MPWRYAQSQLVASAAQICNDGTFFAVRINRFRIFYVVSDKTGNNRLNLVPKTSSERNVFLLFMPSQHNPQYHSLAHSFTYRYSFALRSNWNWNWKSLSAPSWTSRIIFLSIGISFHFRKLKKKIKTFCQSAWDYVNLEHMKYCFYYLSCIWVVVELPLESIRQVRSGGESEHKMHWAHQWEIPTKV